MATEFDFRKFCREGGTLEEAERVVREQRGTWHEGLMGACEGGRVELTKLMLQLEEEDLDWDKEVKRKKIKSAFRAAGRSNQLNIITSVVQQMNEDIVKVQYYREISLGACEGGHEKVFKDLLTAGKIDKVRRTDWFIIQAAYNGGNENLLEYLKSQVQDAWDSERLQRAQIEGACFRGDLNLVKHLIPAVPLNVVFGCFIQSCSQGHEHIARFLLETMGPGYVNHGLKASCKGGHLELAKYMMEMGATNLYEGLSEACCEGIN